MRSRISRHLQSVLRTSDGDKSVRAAAFAGLVSGARHPPISPEFTGHQYAIFLLRVAAGIEHALMAQYLYAAYSLGGPTVGAGDRELVTRWQEVILGIAKEEMGHLITVQNVLRLISGPISFDREDYPYDAAFYPFDFTLEKLSLGSLAKYVYAEKPPNWSGPLADEITRLARKANHDAPLNAVSELYSLMIETIADRSLVPDGVFRAETRPEQASWNEWGRGYAHGARGNAHEGGPVGTPDVIVDTMASRGDAVAALRAIAEQGEATTLVDRERSHFERFRAIYVQWKDRERKGPFNPVRPVAANPVVEDSLGGPPPVTSGACTVITQPVAFYWGHLFNVRYRLLLSALTHVFESTGVYTADAQPTARSELITLIFGEMYKVRGLASVLVELPAHAGVPSTQLAAGPPFEMPYTLSIPRREVDRWRWHNDMLAASHTILVELHRLDHDPRRAAFARAIADGDAELMRRIELIISGLASSQSGPVGGRV
jgi:hypothetical protein